jgi:hypothetical protein
MKLLKILILLFTFEIAFAQTSKPKISLSFPESFRANEEIEASISITNLKKAPYDLKISIEKDKKVLSETYNEKEGKWQDSFYYLKNLFFGPNFEGKFKLKMKKEFLFFEGEAEVVAKVRESGKSSYSQFRGKVKISRTELLQKADKREVKIKEEVLAQLPQNVILEKREIYRIIIALLTALFSSVLILVLKLKLKSLSQK